MQTYGHLRDKHSAEMAQKVVFHTEQASPTNAVTPPSAPSVKLENESEQPQAQKLTVAKAKAKYGYPWWASADPVEAFWGQANEPIHIIPLEIFHEYAVKAMGREVFAQELEDKEALVSEFCVRVGATAVAQLNAKVLSVSPTI